MAGVSATSMQNKGPSIIRGGGGGELDTVVSGVKKEGPTKQNSLNKIAKFKPTQLKNFSSNITQNISRNKEATQKRNAEQTLVNDKVKSIKAQNPFANKGVAESKSGSKLNILT